MTDENVLPVDPNDELAPVDPAIDPVDPNENDDELNPGNAGDPPADETPEQLKARLAESEQARKNLWARLQREKNKPATPPAPTPPAAPASLTRDEAIILAKGHSEEELEQAKKVAVLENCTPVQALEKDLFKDWKARRDADVKQQQAQLPASRGARATVKKSLNTPGLSDDEHKQLAKERLEK
jgi:hypothetical protein